MEQFGRIAPRWVTEIQTSGLIMIAIQLTSTFQPCVKFYFRASETIKYYCRVNFNTFK